MEILNKDKDKGVWKSDEWEEVQQTSRCRKM